MSSYVHGDERTGTTVGTIDDGTRLVIGADDDAVAAVTVADDGTIVHVHFAHFSGQMPIRTRRELVNRLFRLAELNPARRVQIDVPLGEAELISRLHDYLDDIQTRAAGATCLVEGTTRSGDSSDRAPTTLETLAVRRVIQRVAELFPQIERGEIADVVRGQFALYEASKIREFIPVLVERSTREALIRTAAAHADAS